MREFRELLDERCLSEEPAFCTAECPFGLDVREFISKAEKGSFRAAYRLFAEGVGFPAIVAQFCDAACEKKCIRGETDGAVQLSKLERSVLSMVSDRRPNNYFMPPKDKRIVIIGGGLSGLGCALKCCWQKYHVEIFEQSDRLGGSLWQADPEGSFLEEITNRFMYEKPEIHLNTRVESLEALEFDAAYIATGKEGSRFGLKRLETGAFATDRQGVFMGGELTGRTRMEALADGLEAVYAIERFVKTGLMNQPEKQRGTRLRMNTALIVPREPVPAGDGLFDKEGIMKEAGRCLKCRCDACLKGCDLMNFYKKYPRRIEEEVEITIHPGTLSGNGTVATRLIATCNHCGRCAAVCPQGIDVGKFLLANHNIMRAKGAMPRVFHEFWLRDMTFSMEEAALVLAPAGNRTGRVLFTGCRIGGTMPDTVKKLYAALLKEDSSTALWLSCCGLPAEWAGEEDLHRQIKEKMKKTWEDLGKPAVLCACESCLKSIRENLPEIPAESVYPLLDVQAGSGSLLPDEPEKKEADPGILYSVFDPCAAAKDPEAGAAVRKLAEKMGYPPAELPRNGAYASCCSFGGHTAVSNPHYTDEVVRARAAESENPYITYCANCRDVFVQAGKPAVHILELLFGDGKPDLLRKTPTPSGSRENRRRLKEELTAQYAGTAEIRKRHEMEKIRLTISEELLEKIGRERLLTEDVEEVVRFCEESGKKVREEETGIFSGHKMIGCATVWVSYRCHEDGNCELVNVWWHRMQITER